MNRKAGETYTKQMFEGYREETDILRKFLEERTQFVGLRGVDRCKKFKPR